MHGAHAQTVFQLYEAHKSPVAKKALERIAALYAIEEEIRGRSAVERRQVRNHRCRWGPSRGDLQSHRDGETERSQSVVLSKKRAVAHRKTSDQSHRGTVALECRGGILRNFNLRGLTQKNTPYQTALSSRLRRYWTDSLFSMGYG